MAGSHNNTRVNLMPGEYFVGGADAEISTVLGSCVSITLWHASRRIGAMSHFVLAGREREPKGETALDARYGEDALKLMLRDLAALGVAPGECEAKIFGGGNMFPYLVKRDSNGIGRKNGDLARQLLLKYGIPVVSESLFGCGHRRIRFTIATGAVWARQGAPVIADAGSIIPMRRTASTKAAAALPVARQA